MKAFTLKARTGPSFSDRKTVSLQPPDSIYVMGVCGTAMASLAIYLKGEGFKVFGSDQNIYPPMSEALKQAGISVSSYQECNIKSFFKLILVGNVISRDHKEIKVIQNLEIPCLSFPEFLEQTLLSRTKNIVITGTHGKSTGTALMSHVGEETGNHPGFFVGAMPKNFPFSFRTLNSSYFVIEGDEYDSGFFAKQPKFFYYKPFAVLLTGLEFDHGDIYNSLEEITEWFRRLVRKIPKEGCLVVCIQHQDLGEVIKEAQAPVLTYGVDKGDYTIKNRSLQEEGQSFDICYKKEVYPCFIPLVGEHNALNALGVFALSHHLGWPVKKVLQALKTFKGLKRRLEFKGFFQGGVVYEDFAHHPGAVKACLSALREKYPEKKLIALFEPNSFTSRTNVFQTDYIPSFQKADVVFIMKARNVSKIPPEKRFSAEKLAQDLKQKGKSVFCCKSFEELKKAFTKQMDSHSVAVFMSSGSFGGLLDNIKWKHKRDTEIYLSK